MSMLRTEAQSIEVELYVKSSDDVSADHAASRERFPARTVTLADVADPAPADLVLECHRLREAQRIGRVGSWRHDISTRRISVSATLLELYGLDPATQLETYAPLQELAHPDDRDLLYLATDELLLTGKMIDVRFRIYRADNHILHWFHARGDAERDGTGAVVALLGTVADVTEMVQAEIEAKQVHQELSHALDYQQAVVAATPDAIHVYDLETAEFRRANRAGGPLNGFTHEAAAIMVGQSWPEYLDDADRLRLLDLLADGARLRDGQVAELRHPVHADDGTTTWLSRRVTPFARDADGQATALLVASRDVSDVVAAEEKLHHAATHDDLTGLANRRLFHEQLQIRRRGPLGDHQQVVLLCDLDGFKRINDTHGHRTGDLVLVEVADRLRAATRSQDLVARLGGDEFAVLLDLPADIDAEAHALAVARRINAATAQPIRVGGVEHNITISIGIRVAPIGGWGEDALADADAAMYFVKRHGANGHTFFRPSHRPDAAREDYLERLIRRALTDDAVHVHYQPIVDPRTGAAHGVEALMRVFDRDTGRYADAAEVVAVAERTGQIIALDQRVIELAAARAAQWREQPESTGLRLKVNRSAKEISRPGLYDRIRQVLAESGLAPHALTLELTETVLLDINADTVAELRRLRELGVGLAIDDFGTGYASLRYLADLPVTAIKIDRSFTRRLPHHATSMTLVRATVSLADELGLTCIVEGVETVEQLAALPDRQPPLIQGYLYSKPAPYEGGLPARFEPSG